MKFPKLVKVTRKVLSDTKQAAREREKNLREIQRKLEKKGRKLQEKLEYAQDEESEKSISQKISVVNAQLKKVAKELGKLHQDDAE